MVIGKKLDVPIEIINKSLANININVKAEYKYRMDRPMMIDRITVLVEDDEDA